MLTWDPGKEKDVAGGVVQLGKVGSLTVIYENLFTTLSTWILYVHRMDSHL